MRFMMMIKADAKSEAGTMPDEALLSAMGQYNEELVKAGVLLSGEGLQPSSKAVRVRFTDGKLSVVDGPFAEPNTLLAGYWLLRVDSKEAAVAWAKRVPGQDGELELRALFEVDDFPADPAEQPDGWRDQEQRQRDEAEAAAPARKPGTKRFILLLRSDSLSETNALPSAKTLTEMGALMGEYTQSGALLSGEGLKPSAHGARVKRSGSARSAVDGPFTESKELIAGYITVQLASQQEAIALAKRWSQIHGDGARTRQGEIEIRQLFELEDFAVGAREQPGGWREQERAFRDQHGQ
jgi:hypothetical protein